MLKDPRADDLLMNGYMRLASAKARIAAVKDALLNAKLAEAAADRAAATRPQTRHSQCRASTHCS